MISRTDQHDIDKLGRWHRELTGPSSNRFPVSAVFLVSEAAQVAHDVFRAFRRSFEQRGAGFGNLIIFGQHGVSSTVQALLCRLSLPPDAIPLLVLLPTVEGSPAYRLPLPAGSAPGTISDGRTGPALELLSRVEGFAERSGVAFDVSGKDISGMDISGIDVSGITGLTEIPLPAADLVTLVGQLVGEIGQ